MQGSCFKVALLALLPLIANAKSLAHKSQEIDGFTFTQVDTILVEKEKRSMTLLYKNQPVKKYRIALGFSPTGHKIMQGDGKTPEGKYTIVAKNPGSKFHLSLKLSYPSQDDVQHASKLGVAPGDHIMIHGLSPANQGKGKWHSLKDWTLGCIAVTNEEIEEIFTYADVGTKVEILP